MQRDRFFRWCERLLLLVALAPVAANSGSQSADSSVLIGERFIDAFYSWRAERFFQPCALECSLVYRGRPPPLYRLAATDLSSDF